MDDNEKSNATIDNGIPTPPVGSTEGVSSTMPPMGAPFVPPPSLPPYGYMPPQGQYQYMPVPPYGFPPQPKPPQGMGIASMVLGICAIVMFFLPVLAMILGVVGLVLGIVSRGRNRDNGYALAGIITSSIGILIGLLIVIAIVGLIGSLGNLFYSGYYSDIWY